MVLILGSALGLNCYGGLKMIIEDDFIVSFMLPVNMIIEDDYSVPFMFPV